MPYSWRSDTSGSPPRVGLGARPASAAGITTAIIAALRNSLRRTKLLRTSDIHSSTVVTGGTIAQSRSDNQQRTGRSSSMFLLLLLEEASYFGRNRSV